MIAPFYKFEYFGDEIGLIIAFITGIGFGFFLERAGFGNGVKLAHQFYFKDLTVFKVMFTAIITAMLGVFYLVAVGFMDLSMVYISDTYLVPQIIGGLILGFGFVIGGYCPGTSVVSCSTGRIDGLFYLLGVGIGTIVFNEIFPAIEDFFYSSSMGKQTLYDFFNIPYGFFVFMVVLMALGGFLGAEWVEKKFGYKKGGN